MNKYTVVSMIADDKNIVLYFDDGGEHVLPTDQKLTHDIVEKVTAALSNNQTIEFTEEEFTDSRYIHIYPATQEKVKGISFFRTLKKFFVGETPTPPKEIIFLPVANHTELTEEETLVAIVANDNPAEEPVLVPYVENLAPQIEAVAEGNLDPEGLEKFMKRIAKVISKRQHSIEDLLAFLRQNDLPITNDGCILAYKRLNKKGDHFVDTYTGKVTQRIGSVVEVNEYMVNSDRRNECSNGLHVGRKDYMGNFSGNSILLVKVAPEDVIAVPRDYRRSKMRTCRYQILLEVNNDAFNNIIKSDTSLTYNEKMARLLGHLVAGNHTPAKEIVHIGGHQGNDVTVRAIGTVTVDLRDNVTPVEAPVTAPEADTPTAVALNGEQPKDDAKAAPSVSEEAKPKASAKAKSKAKPKKKPVKAIKTLNTNAAEKTKDNKVAPVTVKDIKKKTAPKAEPVKEAPKPTTAGDLSKADQKKLKADLDAIKAGTLTKTQVAAKWSIARSTLAKWEQKYFPSK